MIVTAFIFAYHILLVTTSSNISDEVKSNAIIFDTFRNVFDIRNLDVTNFRKNDELTNRCKMSLNMFLAAVKNHEFWALEMIDSNGRYSSSWFLGNQYWTGSKFQCKHLNEIQNLHNSHDFLVSETEFLMLKVLLNSDTFNIINKSIFWGICVPKSCSGNDIRIVFTLIKQSLIGNDLKIDLEQIKEHNYYNFLDDPVFYYSSSIFFVVFVISVIGTYYDIPQKKDTLYLTENNETFHSYKKKNYTILMKIVLAFSIKANLKSIFQFEIGNDTIPVLHGLRFLSMCWIIASHTCLVTSKYSDNPKFQTVVKDEMLTKTILNGAYNVDTFFFISGLLVTLLYLRNNKRGEISSMYKSSNGFLENSFHFFGLIVYRIVRLSTPYMYIILIQILASKWFYYNSVFDPPYMDHETCSNYWWRNILYINTFFPVQQMCMIWSWYLANDTQFYIIAAMLLVLYKNYPKLSCYMFLGCLILSWIVTGYISYINGFVPNYDNALNLFDELYDKPYTRLGPYFIGMLTGWIFYKTDCKIAISKLNTCIGWVISTMLIYVLLYAIDDVHKSTISGACYSCLSHTIWAICMLWITLACSNNCGGIVSWFLSHELIRPFSRLTYCAYLVHPIVIRSTVMTLDGPIRLNRILIGLIYLGQLSVSFIFALVLSLFFEAPIISILRIFAGRKSN